jgi:hypothetical protein
MNISKVFCQKLAMAIGPLLLFAASVPAQEEQGIVTIPPYPTPNSSIYAAVYGNWRDSCVPVDPQVTLSEKVIRIDFPPAVTSCLMVLTPWEETVPIDGRLSVGTYEVIVTRGEEEIARSSFTVREPYTGSVPTINLRRLVCTNLRTGKKVLIKESTVLGTSPANFEECLAAGLKARPGDRIWKTFKGKAE